MPARKGKKSPGLQVCETLWIMCRQTITPNVMPNQMEDLAYIFPIPTGRQAVWRRKHFCGNHQQWDYKGAEAYYSKPTFLFNRDNGNFAPRMNYNIISIKSLMRNMETLPNVAEEIARNLLSKSFSLDLHGWILCDNHYLAVIANITVPTESSVYQSLLSAFSFLENKWSQSAQEHTSFLLFVLDQFGRSMDGVVTLYRDNWATNYAFATRLLTKFIGYVITLDIILPFRISYRQLGAQSTVYRRLWNVLGTRYVQKSFDSNHLCPH